MPSGVRNALDRRIDRAIGSRSAEAFYLGSLCAASALSWVLIKVGRILSR